MEILPISVVIPTRNSRNYLEEHVSSMEPWVGSVREVIVVDSESTDGTPDFFRERLRHPQTHILSHPPGLYQSWNFGIGRAQSKYTYISTIGDSITLRGLEHLVDAAEKLRADIVVSPPAFRYADGMGVSTAEWPIHEMIRALKITSPEVVDKARLFCSAYVFAVNRGLSGVTGSAASNLFLTKTLHKFPFPTNCGTVGDTFWGLEHALDITFAITPETHSTFLFHLKTIDQNGLDYNLGLIQKARERAKIIYKNRLQPEFATEQAEWSYLVYDLFEAMERKHQFTCILDELRKSNKLWTLDPKAWKFRYARNYYRQQIEKLTATILTKHRYNPGWADRFRYKFLVDSPPTAAEL